jgi:hypothetical protein
VFTNRRLWFDHHHALFETNYLQHDVLMPLFADTALVVAGFNLFVCGLNTVASRF